VTGVVAAVRLFRGVVAPGPDRMAGWIPTVAAARGRISDVHQLLAAPAGLEPVPPAGLPKDGTRADLRFSAGTLVVQGDFNIAVR
jgi:hypothetical protein